MNLLTATYPSDRSCRIHLIDGSQLIGALIEADDAWLLLERDAGDRLLVNRAQVLVISDVDQQPIMPAPAKKAARKGGGGGAASASAARNLSDDDLRDLAHAFLENEAVPQLADRYGKTRGFIKELRMSFEAARGNINEDDLSPVAQTWVNRWSAVLAR